MNEIPFTPWGLTEFSTAEAGGSTNDWFAAVQDGTTAWPTYADQGRTECKGLASTYKGAICHCAGIQWQGANSRTDTAPGYSFDRGSCWLLSDCYKASMGHGTWCFDIEERPGAQMCRHSCGTDRRGSTGIRDDGLDIDSNSNKNSVQGLCPGEANNDPSECIPA